MFAALAEAQMEIGNAHKDKTNPHYKSSYADLASIRDATREPFAKNELCLTQLVCPMGGRSMLVTILGHSSGEWLRSYLPIEPTKRDPQGVGSAITYARRQSHAAIAGVAPDDDDGNAASAKPTRRVAPPKSNEDLILTKSEKASVKDVRQPDTPISIAEKGRILKFVETFYPHAAEAFVAYCFRVKYFPDAPKKSFSWKKVTRGMATELEIAFKSQGTRDKAIAAYEKAGE